MKRTMDRAIARVTILAAANRGAYRKQMGTPYTARTIQQAVCRCRRFGLVEPKILEAAGFNPKPKR
jgi:hypothetical protein